MVEVEAALWDILKSKNPDGDLHGEYHNKPINHPGRYQLLQYFDYHCAAATPPSKANLSSHLFFSVGFSFVNDAGSVKFQ
jgi:hypothetical protein